VDINLSQALVVEDFEGKKEAARLSAIMEAGALTALGGSHG
jgi:hypothetical protein